MKKFLLISIIASSAIAAFGQEIKSDQSTLFWAELQKNCGKAFSGTVENAPAGDTTFKDRLLVIHVRKCEKDTIKIPLFVGSDRSRTWVFTKIGDRIRLKHDHRHEDGKPDEVTNYGGTTTNGGLALLQVFPADDETASIIPAAASNVWWVEIVSGEWLLYNLKRFGTDRFFSLKFDLKKTVEAPEAPWGWNAKEIAP